MTMMPLLLVRGSRPSVKMLRRPLTQKSCSQSQPQPVTFMSNEEVTKMLSAIREEALAKVMEASRQVELDKEAILVDRDPSQLGMGAFTSRSAQKVSPSKDTDNQLVFNPTTYEQFLARCSEELGDLPSPLDRKLTKHKDTDINHEKGEEDGEETIRILNWNLLSQALGSQNDGFVSCPSSALCWETRRWRVLEELVKHRASLLCLQEVDHFPLLERALDSVGYSGHFVPKPDSPCIYLPSNSGPDGCAIFYHRDHWELVGEVKSRIIEVWRVQTNQVILATNLRRLKDGVEVTLATCHLKARPGALLATLRNEQGKDLLDWLTNVRAGRPLILTGDFNAQPEEPVYSTITESLVSAYPKDTQFTTWKIRESGEQKSIHDYIFVSKDIGVSSTLDMPTEQQIGPNRLPSTAFASDHLSLVADLKLA